MSTVAFIGLGLMGDPMARNLLKGGHVGNGVFIFAIACDASNHSNCVVQTFVVCVVAYLATNCFWNDDTKSQ